MTNNRDFRNYRKGYQAAMVDIRDALERGGVEEVEEWIKNNLREEEVTKR